MMAVMVARNELILSPSSCCHSSETLGTIRLKSRYCLSLLAWYIPTHARSHSNAALRHDLLDTLQSYHLGLGNRIHNVLCSKFIQICTEKGDQKETMRLKGAIFPSSHAHRAMTGFSLLCLICTSTLASWLEMHLPLPKRQWKARPTSMTCKMGSSWGSCSFTGNQPSTVSRHMVKELLPAQEHFPGFPRGNNCCSTAWLKDSDNQFCQWAVRSTHCMKLSLD